VLEIEDKTGGIPMQFKRLIKQLAVDARKISGLKHKPA
jgi:hypothetical protein